MIMHCQFSTTWNELLMLVAAIILPAIVLIPYCFLFVTAKGSDATTQKQKRCQRRHSFKKAGRRSWKSRRPPPKRVFKKKSSYRGSSVHVNANNILWQCTDCNLTQDKCENAVLKPEPAHDDSHCSQAHEQSLAETKDQTRLRPAWSEKLYRYFTTPKKKNIQPVRSNEVNTRRTLPPQKPPSQKKKVIQTEGGPTFKRRPNERQTELPTKKREQNANLLHTLNRTKHLDTLKRAEIRPSRNTRPTISTSCEIPKIEYDKSEHGFYNLTVTRRGGRLKLPFLRVLFPPNCVRTSMNLRFKSVHAKDPERDKSITLVTPAIHISKSKEFFALEFLRPIELFVRSLFHLAEHAKEVKLQTTNDSTKLNWKIKETLNLSEDQEYIQVKLQHFAGFRIVSSSPIPSCGLFHALFVKRPTGISDPVQHNFYVLVHSSDDKSCHEANATLNSASVEVVAHIHFLPIKPPCTFTASLECGSSGMTIDPEYIDYDIDTVDQKFLETFPICIMKGADEPPMDHLKYAPIMYRAWSAHREQPRKIWFQWSVPMFEPSEQLGRSYSASSVNSCIITDSGFHSLDQQNNYYNYVLQSPTPNEGSFGLPHSKSEPLFWEHPSKVSRKRSFPATLNAALLRNQSNLWFPDRSPKPNQSLISESSTQVENVWPSGRNETVPKTTSLPTSETRSNRSGVTSLSPTVRQNLLATSVLDSTMRIHDPYFSQSLLLDGSTTHIGPNIKKEAREKSAEDSFTCYQTSKDFLHPGYEKSVMYDRTLKSRKMKEKQHTAPVTSVPTAFLQSSCKAKTSEFEQLTRPLAEEEIGPDGGTISLGRHQIDFPIGALFLKTSILIEVLLNDADYDQHELPKNLIPISHVIDCKSGGVQFNKPVTFTLPIWFKVFEQVVPPVFAYVYKKRKGHQWECAARVRLGTSATISFECSHFCKFGTSISKDDALNGDFALEYFLCAKQTVFLSCVCVSESMLLKEQIEMYQQSGFKIILPPGNDMCVSSAKKIKVSLTTKEDATYYFEPHAQTLTLKEFPERKKKKSMSFTLKQHQPDEPKVLEVEFIYQFGYDKHHLAGDLREPPKVYSGDTAAILVDHGGSANVTMLNNQLKFSST